MASSATACPKCGYVRTGQEENPDWQCPSCGVAYRKYAAYLARMKAQLNPLDGGLPAPRVEADSSVWILVAANLFALALAYVFDWQLAELLAVYWMQSLIIGVSYLARIAQLKRFTTEGFRINDAALPPDDSTRKKVAAMFVLHFGFFHFVYLIFILSRTEVGIFLNVGFLACACAFAVNHYFSYRYNLALDQQGEPNIGKLMVIPYSRILPMHLTIIFGFTMSAEGGLLIFGLLKVLADVLMHVNEHRWLRGSSDFNR